MRSAVKRLADGIAMAANAAGTLVVVLLVAVVNYDIIARGLFNRPFLGAVEVVQFSMVLIVFLQLPDVIRVGRLTRSDGFLGLLAVRAPKCPSGFVPYRGAAVNIFDAKPVKVLQNDVHVLS